jgi:ADP-L-glycero-D-manno-heptose 6-epimerase
MRSVVGKAFDQIRKDGKVRLFKSYHPDFPDGGQKRDFLYVKDAAEITLHLAGTERAAGLYNVGSGVASTWLELVTPVFEALRVPPRIEFIDMPEALRAKYQYFTRSEVGKLAASGYGKPITPLADAVKDYVLGYLAPGKRLGDGLTE